MRIAKHPSRTHRRHVGLMLLPLVLAVLGGCGGSRQVLTRQMVLPFTDEQREALEQTEAAPYTLQRGDRFSVETLIDEELRQPEILVLPDGTASLVHLGNMSVAGLSIEDLEERINDAYRRDFRDVNLNVVLREIARQQVFVLGEVKNPGLFAIDRQGTSLLGAIAMAGGFTEWSTQGSVVLLRMTPEGYLSREFDLEGLRRGAVFDPAAYDLRPFDIIYVNRSKIGDFASFTRNVVSSLLQYSRLVLDARIIENPALYTR